MIYIVTSCVITGGPELLHQFCFYANKFKPGIAKILYVGKKEVDSNFSFFKKYISKEDVVESVVDSSDNFVVVPETMTSYLRDFSNINKVVWWLSVDNYFLNYGTPIDSLEGKVFMILRQLKRRLYYRDNPLTMIELKAVKHHWFQSLYASDLLQNKFNIPGKYLSDYLDRDLIEPNAQSLSRNNVILYNPKKGFKETRKIIEFISKRHPGYCEFVPLIGYNRADLTQLFRSSKIYLDFGYHPGKDRMPREAAINGCIVLTNKKGSASYFRDVSIPDLYKFKDTKAENLLIMGKLILNIMNDYQIHSEAFNQYKEIIRRDEDMFQQDLKSILQSLDIK